MAISASGEMSSKVETNAAKIDQFKNSMAAHTSASAMASASVSLASAIATA